MGLSKSKISLKLYGHITFNNFQSTPSITIGFKELNDRFRQKWNKLFTHLLLGPKNAFIKKVIIKISD